MNFKKTWKRFFSLSRRSDGFTLVELIVVIAILAILAGVGVPAYNGYIKKANMGADQTLASEVRHALELHYYANPTKATSAYVKLTTEGAEAGNEFAAAAMDAVFGEGWEESAKLKYDGWVGMTTDKVFAEAYTASSYSGNEDALITQIGSVTNLLKDALANNKGLVGGTFGGFLTNNGVDTSNNQAVSNAAILYAADTIGEMDATKEAAVNTAFQNFYNPNAAGYGNVNTLTTTLADSLGTYGAVAAIYAHGEAFGQYVASNGNADLLNDFHNIDVSKISNPKDALAQVGSNLETMVQTAATDTAITPITMQYIGNGQYAKDVTAYLETMKKIDANADKFADKLGSDGCYTDGTAAGMLQAAVTAGSLDISCSDGQVLVVIDKNGNAVSTIFDN